jgi:hypothetical protein
VFNVGIMSKSSKSFEEGSPDHLEYKGAKGEYWQAQGEVSEVSLVRGQKQLLSEKQGLFICRVHA